MTAAPDLLTVSLVGAVSRVLNRRAAALEAKAKAGVTRVETTLGGVVVASTIVSPEAQQHLRLAAIWRKIASAVELEFAPGTGGAR